MNKQKKFTPEYSDAPFITPPPLTPDDLAIVRNSLRRGFAYAAECLTAGLDGTQRGKSADPGEARRRELLAATVRNASREITAGTRGGEQLLDNVIANWQTKGSIPRWLMMSVWDS